MLKRNIALLIAGGLSAQAGLAVAAPGTFPPRAEETAYSNMLPAQINYLEERAAGIRGVVRGDSFPPRAEETAYSNMLPAQAQYFEERAAGTQTAARGAAAAGYSEALRRSEFDLPAPAAAAQKTVRVNASTKYISAEHLDTVKFENDKGQSFVWRFDSLGEYGFPISVIAPKDFAAGTTRIYINHPPVHRSDG